MSMGPGAAGAGLIIGGCFVIVAGMDYGCTPNCLHKRGSGQEAILFLCTCLGDLASLARAADRADPEVCANALLTQTQARPAITPCVLPLSSQVFPLCFFLSDSATTWPPACEKQNEPNLGSCWCKHFHLLSIEPCECVLFRTFESPLSSEREEKQS